MDKLVSALLSEEFIDELLSNDYFIEQLQLRLAGGRIGSRTKILSYEKFIDLTENEIINKLNSDDIEKYDEYLVRMCNENRLTSNFFNHLCSKSLHICRLLTNRNCKINNIFEKVNSANHSIAYSLIESCCNSNIPTSIVRYLDFERIARLVPNNSTSPMSMTDFYYSMKDEDKTKYRLFAESKKFELDYTKNIVIDQNLVFNYIFVKEAYIKAEPCRYVLFDLDFLIKYHKKYNHPPISSTLVTSLFKFEDGKCKIKNLIGDNKYTTNHDGYHWISTTNLKKVLTELCYNDNDTMRLALLKYCDAYPNR